jgi:hypothetical protein
VSVLAQHTRRSTISGVSSFVLVWVVIVATGGTLQDGFYLVCISISGRSLSRERDIDIERIP